MVGNEVVRRSFEKQQWQPKKARHAENEGEEADELTRGLHTSARAKGVGRAGWRMRAPLGREAGHAQKRVLG